MDLMQWMQAAGGLAIFIFGMKLMSDGLHHVAGERMRQILRMFSANRFVGVVSGAVVTSVIQSSSASTVMIIGFVNAGLLSLVQAMGLIFGANIGTTVTAQLVAFDIAWVIMPAIILGLLMSFIPRPRAANWSETIIGFGFLFLGMETMSSTLKVMAQNPVFMRTFQTFQCAPGASGVIPVLSLLGAIGIGIAATCIIQSSSACSGIVIALGASGLLDIYTAVALVLGSNIGTTVTAQLAALTANRIAKQTALAHTLFNCIGVLIIMIPIYIIWNGEPLFFKLIDELSLNGDVPRKIANAHTLFNVFTTLILLPFIPLLAKVCEKCIPVRESRVKYEKLEKHFLDAPSIALTQTTSALHNMLKKSWKMIDCTLNLYNRNTEKNQKLAKQLDKREADIDERQKAITEYLSLLMMRPLTARESEQIPMLLHCTNDAERIGDHAEIIKAAMEKLKNDSLHFSKDAEKEYDILHDMLSRLADTTIKHLANPTPALQSEANRLQGNIQSMLERSEAEHFSRISSGSCRAAAGILFLEILEEIRKVSRHLENINDRAVMFYGKFPNAHERGGLSAGKRS